MASHSPRDRNKDVARQEYGFGYSFPVNWFNLSLYASLLVEFLRSSIKEWIQKILLVAIYLQYLVGEN